MKQQKIFLLHLVLWLVFVLPIGSAPIFVFKVQPELILSFYPQATINYVVMDALFNLVTFGLSFYAFYFWVFEWFFVQPKSIINWLKTGGLFFVIYIAELLAMEQLYPPEMIYPDLMIGIEVTMFVWLLFRLGLGVGARALIEYSQERKQRKELEQLNFQSELSLFRAQVNPHFLFNTLNNIDALIYTNPDKASATLIKLSKQMRYMLYDSNVAYIDLALEVEFIQNYIDLESIRLKNKNYVSLELEGKIKGIKIAPMLFIAFIENAFKHGSNKQEDAGLRIKLKVDDQKLYFECHNHYDAIEHKQQVKYSGIGLDLVKKRLNLLYGEQYDLKIEDIDQCYHVYLALPLTKKIQ